MDILHIITQMLMIFGIVLVGLFAAKRNLWAGDLDRKLSIFIMNISMPALILASVMGKDLAFETHLTCRSGRSQLHCTHRFGLSHTPLI